MMWKIWESNEKANRKSKIIWKIIETKHEEKYSKILELGEKKNWIKRIEGESAARSCLRIRTEKQINNNIRG